MNYPFLDKFSDITSDALSSIDDNFSNITISGINLKGYFIEQVSETSNPSQDADNVNGPTTPKQTGALGASEKLPASLAIPSFKFSKRNKNFRIKLVMESSLVLFAVLFVQRSSPILFCDASTDTDGVFLNKPSLNSLNLQQLLELEDDFEQRKNDVTSLVDDIDINDKTRLIVDALGSSKRVISDSKFVAEANFFRSFAIKADEVLAVEEDSLDTTISKNQERFFQEKRKLSSNDAYKVTFNIILAFILTVLSAIKAILNGALGSKGEEKAKSQAVLAINFCSLLIATVGVFSNSYLNARFEKKQKVLGDLQDNIEDDIKRKRFLLNRADGVAFRKGGGI